MSDPKPNPGATLNRALPDLSRTAGALPRLDEAAAAFNVLLHRIMIGESSTTDEQFDELSDALDAAAREVALVYADETADRNPGLRRDIESGLIGTRVSIRDGRASGKMIDFVRRMVALWQEQTGEPTAGPTSEDSDDG